jgi:hypothetical protein
MSCRERLLIVYAGPDPSMIGGLQRVEESCRQTRSPEVIDARLAEIDASV